MRPRIRRGGGGGVRAVPRGLVLHRRGATRQVPFCQLGIPPREQLPIRMQVLLNSETRIPSTPTPYTLTPTASPERYTPQMHRGVLRIGRGGVQLVRSRGVVLGRDSQLLSFQQRVCPGGVEPGRLPVPGRLRGGAVRREVCGVHCHSPPSLHHHSSRRLQHHASPRHVRGGVLPGARRAVYRV